MNTKKIEEWDHWGDKLPKKQRCKRVSERQVKKNKNGNVETKKTGLVNFRIYGLCKEQDSLDFIDDFDFINKSI